MKQKVRSILDIAERRRREIKRTMRIIIPLKSEIWSGSIMAS